MENWLVGSEYTKESGEFGVASFEFLRGDGKTQTEGSKPTYWQAHNSGLVAIS